MNSTTLYYDGECGFCHATVRFVLKHEREESIYFAALQGPSGESLVARHPELKDVDSVVLVEKSAPGASEQVFVRSDAVIRLSRHLKGVWRFGSAIRFVPRSLRDAAYDFVARHRQILAKRLACSLPETKARSRFLDTGAGT